MDKYRRDCTYYLKNNKLIDIDLLNQYFDYVINHHRKINFQKGRISLLQGDLHPANILITKNENLCFLDWENARLGDYCEDLAYLKARTLDFMYADSLHSYNELIGYYSDIFKDKNIKERMDYFLTMEYLRDIWRSCYPEISEKTVQILVQV